MLNNDKKTNVLIVDDDKYVLDSISLIMRFHEYDFIACKDAERALKELGKCEFDIMISDINMPGMSGLELLEIVSKIYPDMPAILMTGLAELDAAVEAIKNGAYDFVLKPINPELFLNSIKRALQYSKSLNIDKKYIEALQMQLEAKTQELSQALDKIKSISS